MSSIQDRLTGALIGLARATDGNEHLISPSSTAVVIACLKATLPGENPDIAALEDLLKRVEEEKRKMVPNCFSCASPCGRTSDYDMRMLSEADEDVRSLKENLLRGIREIAAHSKPVSAQGRQDDALHRFFYKALVVIGIDELSAEDLQPILREMDELSLRLNK